MKGKVKIRQSKIIELVNERLIKKIKDIYATSHYSDFYKYGTLKYSFHCDDILLLYLMVKVKKVKAKMKIKAKYDKGKDKGKGKIRGKGLFILFR